MTRQYRVPVDCGVRCSPIWENEAVVFDPVSSQILVVESTAARILRIIQSHPPVTIERICARLREEISVEDPDLRAEVEAVLLEFERLGLVESLAP